MKTVIMLALIFILLPACSPASTATPTSTATATSAPPTRTATLALSTTSLATATPAPPTRTPLPTIPTFTPTFDVRTIVTATPAPKAECPREDPAVSVKIFDGPKKLLSTEEITGIANKILALLNRGAPKNAIAREFLNAQTYGTTNLTEKDITNDGIPELIAEIDNGFAIYKCNHENYEIIFQWWGYASLRFVHLDSIQDMNMNGIPEIIASESACSGIGCQSIKILEWDGLEIIDRFSVSDYGPTTITTTEYDEVGIPLEQDIVDLNKDGLLDFIRTGGAAIGWPVRVGLIRNRTDIYIWNGRAFVRSSREYTRPTYRFQAVQDADRAVAYGQFEKAFSLYENAIFASLDWWSAEREDYLDYDENYTKYNDELTPIPNLTPLPLVDANEHPRLAAYAYYRMVILHTYLGETEAAQTKYATLREKFPAGDPGHPYVEMATAFWDVYQSTGKMYDSCAAAIAYADAHPEILTPLGSDYHGGQSHTYTPSDVCPFR